MSAKLLPEDFGVPLFGKHEHLMVLMLPGHRVPVPRERKFVLPTELPDFVKIRPDTLFFRKRDPKWKVFVSSTGYAPVRVSRHFTGSAVRSGLG